MRIGEARWIPTQIIQRGCETGAFAVSFLIEVYVQYGCLECHNSRTCHKLARREGIVVIWGNAI